MERLTGNRLTCNKRIVVVGLGQTGLACVRFLRGKGVDVTVLDSRDNPPGQDVLIHCFPEVPLHKGAFDVDVMLAADEIVLSPGVALAEPALQQAQDEGIPIVGDIDLFCREVTTPIVAITGSNAKSTVTDLVGVMARASKVKVKVGGNIGIPVLELLDVEPKELMETALYVLELSSFQLETVHELEAEVATVLNVSEDHMDRYKGMQPYVAAKRRIFSGCRKVVVNRDDSYSRAVVGDLIETYSFGVGKESTKLSHHFGVVELEGHTYLAYEQKPLMDVAELKMVGQHNVANALAALALGTAVDLDRSAMLATLKQYSGLPHRCQWVGSWDQVDWFNDSKGTNVGATIAAVEGLAQARKPEQKLILIAGGLGKGQNFSPLTDPVSRHVRHTLLIGEDALTLQKAISQSTLCNSLEEAVKAAAAMAQPGDRVVLSPACSSFDMFAGFEDRGERFIAAVSALYSDDKIIYRPGEESK